MLKLRYFPRCSSLNVDLPSLLSAVVQSTPHSTPSAHLSPSNMHRVFGWHAGTLLSMISKNRRSSLAPALPIPSSRNPNVAHATEEGASRTRAFLILLPCRLELDFASRVSHTSHRFSLHSPASEWVLSLYSLLPLRMPICLKSAGCHRPPRCSRR